MAENILQTIIQLRYDSYSNWMNSDTILKQGEVAIAAFPNSDPSKPPKAIGIKVGNNKAYFYELPWIQGIAADVYNWAKESNKPTYSAEEIQGLQNFVENLITGDTEVNIAPRIYAIVRGTGTNNNKYYLQYKENNENSNWIIDTSSYIDLTNLNNILNWIGEDLTEYDSIAERTEEHIQYDLNRLKVIDSETPSYVVTSVSQEKGKISTTKHLLSFNDFNETLPVAKGGTGQNTLTEDNVLVGNGTSSVKLIPIAEEIANNNHLVPNNLIKKYVDDAVAGLSGAMHFIGEANVVINNNSMVDPQITNYNFSNALPGDVILYAQKEFVWTGSYWHLLGDESSYAIKGTIKNIDIADDAEISQSKIAQLNQTFDTKVDKVEGKTLTSNDFTDELKDKLDNLPANAQANAIEHILLNGTEINPGIIEQLNKAVNIEINEFDSASQTKLQGIEAEAQVNKIEKIIYDGVEITPDANRTVSITSDPHTEHENVIEQIFINDREQPVTNKQVRITIDQEALNLNVVAGAEVPKENGVGKDEIEQIQKKLQFERIAISGDVKNLKQTNDTYIILNCGSSTEVI